MARLEVDIVGNLDNLDKSLSQAQNNLQKFGEKARSIGVALTATVSVAIAGIGVAAIKTFGEIEALKKGLIAVMGSAESAEIEFKKLIEVAKLPGLGLEEAARGSVALQSAGFSADEARGSLLAFGNALATVGKGKNELNFVILALTQLQNKTSGFGQDLRQLTEQLPQLRGALTAAFGTADSDAIAKLGVTGKEVVQLITAEFAKLPKVTGGVKNAFENFGDSATNSMARVGEAINKAFDVEGKIEGVAGAIDRISTAFSELDSSTKTIIITIAGLAAGIGPLLLGIGSIIKLIPVLKAGLISLSGPFGLIAAAVVIAIPLLINLNEELKRTAKIAGEVKADLLAESLKSSREEFERLSKSLESTGLKPLEAQNRAIDLLLKQELNLLNVRGKQNKDIDAIKARVAALNQLKIEINSVTDATGKLTDGLGLIGGLTAQINALNEQRDLAKDQREVNLITAKVTALENQLDLINAIANRASQPIKSEVGILAPRANPFAVGLPFRDSQDSEYAANKGVQTDPTAQMIKATEKGKETLANVFADVNKQAQEFNEMITQTLTNGISSSIADLAFSIGEALAVGGNVFKAIGSSLLDSIGRFLGQLGEQLIQVGVAGLAFATLLETIKAGGPAAIPAAIAAIAIGAAMTVAAGAFRGMAGKGLSGGGGGNVSSGGSSQSFAGSGIGMDNSSINLNGEFIVRGTDLVYVLSQEEKKRSKG